MVFLSCSPSWAFADPAVLPRGGAQGGVVRSPPSCHCHPGEAAMPLPAQGKFCRLRDRPIRQPRFVFDFSIGPRRAAKIRPIEIGRLQRDGAILEKPAAGARRSKAACCESGHPSNPSGGGKAGAPRRDRADRDRRTTLPRSTVSVAVNRSGPVAMMNEHSARLAELRTNPQVDREVPQQEQRP